MMADPEAVKAGSISRERCRRISAWIPTSPRGTRATRRAGPRRSSRLTGAQLNPLLNEADRLGLRLKGSQADRALSQGVFVSVLDLLPPSLGLVCRGARHPEV